MTNDDETYLGDGLFVSFNGCYFRLCAPNEDGDQVVYLEPSVVVEFQRYVERVMKEQRA